MSLTPPKLSTPGTKKRRKGTTTKKIIPLTLGRLGQALISAGAMLFVCIALLSTASGQPTWQAEWEQVKAEAKKEGKLVVNIPPNPALRRTLEAVFKAKFGIELELVLGRGALISRRIADEYQARVRYIDITLSTVDNLMDRIIPMGAVEPFQPTWILPEVKDSKQWWGGHIWTDKDKRFAYAASAYMLDNIWYNTELVKPDEVRSYDDLLNPKWRNKIGFLDPRLGGAGIGIWGFLWSTKGEGFLKKLLDQQLVVAEDRMQADSLARGKLALAMGPTYYRFEAFLRAGLPVKPLPPLKEGTYVSVGVGAPVIIKNSPHPNAAKVFVNWFLSKEGQETYGKVHGHATRRLDVDTKWMSQIGVRAAKDLITLEEFHKHENQSEDKVLTVRDPAREFARKILP
jgi:ABC-type Fe3+ transport system substrate-binding protein